MAEAASDGGRACVIEDITTWKQIAARFNSEERTRIQAAYKATGIEVNSPAQLLPYLDPAIQPDIWIWGSNKGNDDKPFGEALGGAGQAGELAPNYEGDSNEALSHPNYLGVITTQFHGTSTHAEVLKDINAKFDVLEAYVREGGRVHIPRNHEVKGTVVMGLGTGQADGQQATPAQHAIQQQLLTDRVAQLVALKIDGIPC
jgi:hypothetical protein